MTPIKIAFVLCSNSRDQLSSTRISVINMLPFLREAGFDPHMFEPEIVAERPDLTGIAQRLVDADFRIVYFQKVRGRSVEELVQRLSEASVRTVYGVCDFVDAEMTRLTDLTIIVTDFLRSRYPESLQSKVHVVHDGIENPSVFKSDWGKHWGSRGRPLRAVLVTSQHLTCLPVIVKPPPWLEISIVGRHPPTFNYVRRIQGLCREMLDERHEQRMDYLAFLLDRRIRRVAWDARGVYRRLLSADIGIIPIDPHADPRWQVKSENRLTLKMSAGLPVIASPIPAYEPVINQGVNGYLAESVQNWMDCLDALRDPRLRRRIGECARESVNVRFSKEEQARRLVEALESVLQLPGRPDHQLTPQASTAPTRRLAVDGTPP